MTEQLRAQVEQVVEAVGESLQRAATKDRAQDAECFANALQASTAAVRELADAEHLDREQA